MLDVLRLPRHRRRNFEDVHIDGREHVEAARANGRGFLVLSAHCGSWEHAVAGSSARHQVPLALVVRPLSSSVDAFVNEQRRASVLRLIHRSDTVSGVRAALREGRGVVFVLDQNATRNQGVFVDFFGKSACTILGLAVLARRFRVPVFPAFAVRTEGGHTLKGGAPIPWEKKGSLQETLRHMTQRYTHHIEAHIRAYPVDWMWTHKRWRSRPAPNTQAGGAADA